MAFTGTFDFQGEKKKNTWGGVHYDKIGWGHFDKYSFFLSKSHISSEI